MRLRRRLGSPDWPLLQYLGLDKRSYNNLVSGFSLYNEERYEDLEANSRNLVLDADFKALPPHLYKEVLFEDSVVCAVAKNSRYKQKISLSQYLAGEHVSVNILDERQPLLDMVLAKLGVNRNCTFTVPYFGVALRMVAGSHLIATLPRSMSVANLAVAEATDPDDARRARAEAD
jgi:DNA-binding transcriptional LysR family regulator